MRPTLPKSPRRRPSGSGSSATRIAKGGRNAPPAAGGPVAPTAEYVGRRTRRIPGSARAAGTLFPRRRPHVAARRAALALLICACVALITATYRGGVVLHGAQLAVLEVVSPIERGLSRAWDPIANAFDWSGRVVSATNENPKLREENARLREQLSVASSQAADLRDLQRQVDYQDTTTFADNYDKVQARVSVRAPGSVERSLVIDRGSDAGVEVDDAVMVTGGLIGIVTRTSPSQSVVGLIIDDANTVTATDVDSGATGVLETVSTEGTPVMRLKFIAQSEKVKKYDLIVTSDFRSGELHAKLPGGIPIGEVTNVGNDPAEVHKTVQIEPYADFDHLRDVYVLVPKSRGGA